MTTEADLQVAMNVAEKWRELCEKSAEELKLAAERAERAEARAMTAEAEVARLNLRVRDLSSGIVLRGWWCMRCDRFQGEEHEKTDVCRHCERPKTVRT